MPRDLTMPVDLDEHGQQVWSAYRSAREREQRAAQDHRDAKRMMRRHVNQRGVLDPTVPAHYRAARDELAAAHDARRSAEMAYQAYHRKTVGRKKVVAIEA